VILLNRGMAALEKKGYPVYVVPERLARWLGPEALFGIVLLFVLTFGSVSEALGFHFVIGAFFGALLLDKRHFLASRYNELKLTLDSVTGGFLAPVFFAYLGLKFDFGAIRDWGFVLAVLVVSIASKVFAGWWGGRLLGMTRREAFALGGMLNGRGVMELVVASIAYERGFIGPHMFSTLVLMGVVTTLITPWLVGKALPKEA
ncbi:MAG: cation:proton antiporter, partial [Rhodocyclaceae bacterium]|nr:cation:proton antiporter [Rhodocyclaceae bacterium]